MTPLERRNIKQFLTTTVRAAARQGLRTQRGRLLGPGALVLEPSPYCTQIRVPTVHGPVYFEIVIKESL